MSNFRTIYTTSTGNFPKVPGYTADRFEKKWDGEACLAKACADQICKERGLPPGTSVPVFISCPCPRCTPRIG